MDDQICRDTDIYKAKSNEDPQSSVSEFEIKVFWLSFLHNFELLSAFLVSRQFWAEIFSTMFIQLKQVYFN